MGKIKRLAFFALCLCFVMLLAVINTDMTAAAYSDLTFINETSAEKAEIFKNPNGRLMSISRKGDWHSFPENSIAAIDSASRKGADIIEIDVKKSLDGEFFLLEDNTLNRTTNCETGEADVSSLYYEKISSYFLLEKQGGGAAGLSEHKIPTLDDALFLNINALLLLDFDWELRDEIYNKVKACNMLGRVIFLTRASAAASAEWIKSLDETPMTLGYHKGNVVFLATSYINKHLSAGGNGVFLATNNPYGMNFQELVLNKFDNKGRAAASPATPEICGKKTDSEIWWNDLAGRGFSLIITDYPEELARYIQKSLDAMNRLINLKTEIAENFALPDFSADIFTEYKRSFNKASENANLLIAQGFAAEQELHDAYSTLYNAVSNIELNYSLLANGKSGLTITPVRIIVAILTAIAVVSAQVYTHKKTKKIK